MAKVERVRRSPINGSRSILGVQGKDPNFEYRIVNDVGDRVAQMTERGYEVVCDKTIKVGDRRIANPTQEGSAVTVSVGQGVQGVVMRIRKDWYEEDQEAKAAFVNEQESAINRDKVGADYGTVKIERN